MLRKHLELPPPKISYNGNRCSFLEKKWNTVMLAKLLQHRLKINVGALTVSLEAGCVILKNTVLAVRPLVWLHLRACKVLGAARESWSEVIFYLQYVSCFFFFQSFFSSPFLIETSGIRFLSLCKRHLTLQGFQS